MNGKAYYSEDDRCWYVPVADPPLLDAHLALEPCRLELRNGVLRITLLDERQILGYKAVMADGTRFTFDPRDVDVVYRTEGA